MRLRLTISRIKQGLVITDNTDIKKIIRDITKKQHKFNNTSLCKSVFADLSRRLKINKENSSTIQR